MTSPETGLLGRLPASRFLCRQAERDRILSFARAGGNQNIGLVLGPPRVGKSELLRQAFDSLFSEGGNRIPFFYVADIRALEASEFSADYLAQFLSQLIAFRKRDSGLLELAHEPLETINLAAAPEDYLWIRSLIDRYRRAQSTLGDTAALRVALSSPGESAVKTDLSVLVTLDDFHRLLAPDASAVHRELLTAILSTRPSPGVGYLLSGLRRPILQMSPPADEFFGHLDMIEVGPLTGHQLENTIRSIAQDAEVDVSDPVIELMTQQLGGDLFYIRALMAAAASKRRSLKSFMDFERIYTEEILTGRIGSYLDAMRRSIAPDPRLFAAVLEILSTVGQSRVAVPIEALIRKVKTEAFDAESMLRRLHELEWINLQSMDLESGLAVRSTDPVLWDYVRSRVPEAVAERERTLSGFGLLGEKLKDSYFLMMSRQSRATQSKVIQVLSTFDFQSVPAALLSAHSDNEQPGDVSHPPTPGQDRDRITLPQIVSVMDIGSDQTGIECRFFAARGFDGGVYNAENESILLVALVSSVKPLDSATIAEMDRRLDSAFAKRGNSNPNSSGRSSLDSGTGPGLTKRDGVIRWWISKGGFAPNAFDRIGRGGVWSSDLAQLEALEAWLAGDTDRRPEAAGTEFELVIPMEPDSELIAARTAEQIALAAGFEQPMLNQIKTAMIEACINAAEHGESSDRKIYQKFTVTDDKFTITVSNKGKPFAIMPGREAAVAGTHKRGRGLHIIRSLMDEVRFEPNDSGTTLVMSKFIPPQDLD